VALSRVQRLQTPPFAIQEGADAATRPSVLDPHQPQWWAPMLTRAPWLSPGRESQR
jgi:hypothetical protein